MKEALKYMIENYDVDNDIFPNGYNHYGNNDQGHILADVVMGFYDKSQESNSEIKVARVQGNNSSGSLSESRDKVRRDLSDKIRLGHSFSKEIRVPSIKKLQEKYLDGSNQ